jgi:hypothetical protein
LQSHAPSGTKEEGPGFSGLFSVVHPAALMAAISASEEEQRQCLRVVTAISPQAEQKNE